MSVSPPANASPKQPSNAASSSSIAQSQSPTMAAGTTVLSSKASGNGSSSSSASSSQLATMLSAAIHEADSLRKDLVIAQRQASKYERIVNALGGTPEANGVVNGQGGSRSQEELTKLLVDAEARAERAERAQQDAESRFNAIAQQWDVMERYFASLEVRFSDARKSFTHLLQSASQQPNGEPISLATLQPPAPAPSMQAHQLPGISSAQSSPGFARRSIMQAPTSGSQLSMRSSMVSTTPFQTLPLPPPPSANPSISAPHIPSKRSHRRSLIEEYDQPQKRSRLRDERDLSPSTAHQQPSPPYTNATITPNSRSLHDTRLPHGSYNSSRHHSLSRDRAEVDRDRHLSKHMSSQQLPSHGHYDAYAQHVPRGYSSHASPAHRLPERGRGMDRGYARGHSRSRSHSVDSQSIDDLLLETATDQKEGYSVRGRPSGAMHHGAHAGHAGHAGGPAHANDEVGPHRDPPSVQQYQTHIFAPPVTGAPIKKNKSVPASQLVTLGPGGVIVSGGGAAAAPLAASLPGGGYPPTNQQGQRICRQCGMPGRYKDGKCVEKWGPGPEGPGTVCDRCRKKMKRVERRGTVDGSQALAARNSLMNAAAPPPIAPAAPRAPINSGAHSARISPPHRTDTLIMNESQGSSRGNGGSSGGNIGGDHSQMISPRDSAYASYGRGGDRRGAGQSRSISPAPIVERAYAERDQRDRRDHERERDRDRGVMSSTTVNSRTTAQHRRAPTPPYINSISTREQNRSGSRGSSVMEDDGDDGEGDGDNEVDDVDAEIARTLPGGGSRSGSGSGTASVNGSASPKERPNGTSRTNNGNHHYAHANGTAHLSHLANAAVNGGPVGLDKSKSVSGRGRVMADMDIDANEDDADPEADILDAAMATESMKQEDA